MYCHKTNDVVLYPQIGKNVGKQDNQNYFWRCVFCLFESSNRLNKNVRHLLICNQNPPSEIDGINILSLIKKYKIELYDFPCITRPPKDYYRAWNSQFILLDVIDVVCDLVREKEDICFILDSDCVFNRPISKDFELSVKRNKVLLYSLDYPLDYKINGLSRNELKSLSLEYSNLRVEEFVYNGGELICALAAQLKEISIEARKTYGLSLRRHQTGLRKFNEEAQLLSYVYHKLNYRTHTANNYIKRMWTNVSNYRNIERTDNKLIIWHIPAEKKRGFVKLFRKLNRVTRNSNFDYISKVLNVERTFYTFTKDYIFLFLKQPIRFVKKLQNSFRTT